MVNTLQDIRDNKDFKLMGAVGYIRAVSNERFNITDIIDRMIIVSSQYKTVEKVIEDLINCDVVLLYPSFLKESLTFMARSYQDEIFVSNEKYLPDYLTFILPKDQIFTKFIKF